MEHQNKRFDPSLHQIYDDMGKNIVLSYFNDKLGIQAIENPDKYGVDVILLRDKKYIGFAEVEVRNSWKEYAFPYSTLNVPKRKQKLLDNPLPTYFFSINAPGTRMFCCEATAVLRAALQENPNKYVSQGEYFYKVQLDQLKSIDIPESMSWSKNTVEC